MKTPGNKNEAFKPDPNIPFWNQSLNPITMLPVIKNYYDHTKEIGLKEMHINKPTNHFVKNYT